MPEQMEETRLNSWKDIASYLKRDVSTVQRWEKREAMPVHRHLHDKLGSVYAFTTELDEWWQSRQMRLSPPAAAASAPPGIREHRSRFLWAAVGVAALAAIAFFVARNTDYFWRNPLSKARFIPLTDFEGTESAAAISRDGSFVAFLADRDGATDAWVTQAGTGQFHNLTNGKLRELVNPDVRTLGFSPDGAFVSLWVRRQSPSHPANIGIWQVPTLGGDPRLLLDGVAECDWSGDGSRLVYHTPGPGDPTFVADRQGRSARHIFTAPPGLHAHFPVWSPDDRFIYFVSGALPNEMDIWRVDPDGGKPERMTTHNARVTHPTFLDRRTLLYLATDAAGAGPWLYALDVDRHKVRRISSGVERYTSLAGSADGRRLVVTVANVKRTLWRMPVSDGVATGAAAIRLGVPGMRGGRSPRFGPGYLLYVASKGADESIWKFAAGSASELWNVTGGRIVGGPAISPDGRRIAVTAEERGRMRLYVMNGDGSDARILRESLEPRGAPAWSPDGRSIAVAATIDGRPALAKLSADGKSISAVAGGFAADPAWSPDGTSIIYSGPDVGTTFQIRVASADGRPLPQPNITLTRGARRVAFLAGQSALVVLRGDMNHKDLWAIDLVTGRERRLTNFSPDIAVEDFDLSPDGREILFDREQNSSNIVLIER